MNLSSSPLRLSQSQTIIATKNNLDEMDRKGLSCHCPLSPYRNVEMCEERESPLALWQQREVVFHVAFVWQTHSVISSYTNRPSRIETHTTEALLDRNITWKGCVKSPWGMIGGWGGGVESLGTGARSVSPEQKEDLNHLLIRFWQEQSPLCLEYNCTAGSAGILPKWIYLQLCKPNQLSSKW